MNQEIISLAILTLLVIIGFCKFLNALAREEDRRKKESQNWEDMW